MGPSLHLIPVATVHGENLICLQMLEFLLGGESDSLLI